jgi:hypothetical protein
VQERLHRQHRPAVSHSGCHDQNPGVEKASRHLPVVDVGSLIRPIDASGHSRKSSIYAGVMASQDQTPRRRVASSTGGVVPIVVDADVVLQDIRFSAKTGRRSALVSASETGAIRLLISRTAAQEVEEHLPDMVTGGVSRSALDEVRRRVHWQHLWVVDIDPDETDPEVRRVMEADPDDATSITLARLVAPSILFSMNVRHLPLAVDEWLALTRQIMRLHRAESVLQGGESLLKLGMAVPVGGAVAISKLFRRLPPPAAVAVCIGSVAAIVLYLRSAQGQRRRRDAKEAVGQALGRVHAEMEAALQTKAEVARALSPRLIPAVDQMTADPPSIAHRAARFLVSNPASSATELVQGISFDGLGSRWTASRLRTDVLEPASVFVCDQSRWSLGEIAQDERS